MIYFLTAPLYVFKRTIKYKNPLYENNILIYYYSKENLEKSTSLVRVPDYKYKFTKNEKEAFIFCGKIKRTEILPASFYYEPWPYWSPFGQDIMDELIEVYPG